MIITLIDDNDTMNFYTADLIEELGIFKEILTFNTGQKSIDYFLQVKAGNKARPNLILVDVKIPDYDGFEILDEVEDMDIPDIDKSIFCMLTTSSHNRDLESFEKSNMALEYVQKPLTKEVLKGIIDKHLLE